MNNHFHVILHHEAESQNPGMMSKVVNWDQTLHRERRAENG